MTKFYKVVYGEYEDRSVEVFDNLGDAQRFVDTLLFEDTFESSIATYITLFSCEFVNGRLNRGRILLQGEQSILIQARTKARFDFAK